MEFINYCDLSLPELYSYLEEKTLEQRKIATEKRFLKDIIERKEQDIFENFIPKPVEYDLSHFTEPEMLIFKYFYRYPNTSITDLATIFNTTLSRINYILSKGLNQGKIYSNG